MDEITNRPYDLSNPYELKDALLHTVGAYNDYQKYALRLGILVEDFDETLEHSDFSSWIRLGSDPASVDELTYDTTASLNDSAGLMGEIADRARQNLVVVLKAVLASPPDIQAMVWEQAYDAPAAEQDNLLERLFEAMGESRGVDDWPYSLPDALASFLSFFHDFMKQQYSA